MQVTNLTANYFEFWFSGVGFCGHNCSVPECIFYWHLHTCVDLDFRTGYQTSKDSKKTKSEKGRIALFPTGCTTNFDYAYRIARCSAL
jgi:hypothetical protein